MHRRTLLCATAVGATGLLAGCLDDDEPSGRTGTDEASPTTTGDDGSDDGATETGTPTNDGATTDESTDTETATDDDTPTGTDEATATPEGSAGSNAVVDHSFEVVSSDCGQGAQRADVSRGDDRVDVDGTIRGRNGCYTAELEDAIYDEGADELTVAVRSYDDSDGEYCQQCIVDVEYRASFEFRDGTPEEVTVVHDGEHVTTG